MATGQTLIVSIDGLIGAGKTTLFYELERRGYTVFREEVGEWPFLSSFYADPKRWCFASQMSILNNMVNQKSKIARVAGRPSRSRVVFTERTPVSSRVFTETNLIYGNLTVDEKNLFDQFYDKTAWAPDHVIYLDLSVDECMKRIAKRGRACESTMDLRYMEVLESEYLKMPVDLVLDATATTSEIADAVQKFCKKLE